MRRKIRMLLALLMFGAGEISVSVHDKPALEAVCMNESIVLSQVKIIRKECWHSDIFFVVEAEKIMDDSVEESLSQEDIELIALVTMAEAEGESEYGKRLVIDTILNRMDSVHYPDTAYEVVYQPSQFSSMWNGRVDRCYVMDEICQIIKEELQERKNYEVIFFTAGDYGKYGIPMFQEGNHYFSSYE